MPKKEQEKVSIMRSFIGIDLIIFKILSYTRCTYTEANPPLAPIQNSKIASWNLPACERNDEHVVAVNGGY